MVGANVTRRRSRRKEVSRPHNCLIGAVSSIDSTSEEGSRRTESRRKSTFSASSSTIISQVDMLNYFGVPNVEPEPEEEIGSTAEVGSSSPPLHGRDMCSVLALDCVVERSLVTGHEQHWYGGGAEFFVNRDLHCLPMDDPRFLVNGASSMEAMHPHAPSSLQHTATPHSPVEAMSTPVLATAVVPGPILPPHVIPIVPRAVVPPPMFTVVPFLAPMVVTSPPPAIVRSVAPPIHSTLYVGNAVYSSPVYGPTSDPTPRNQPLHSSFRNYVTVDFMENWGDSHLSNDDYLSKLDRETSNCYGEYAELEATQQSRQKWRTRRVKYNSSDLIAEEVVRRSPRWHASASKVGELDEDGHRFMRHEAGDSKEHWSGAHLPPLCMLFEQDLRCHCVQYYRVTVEAGSIGSADGFGFVFGEKIQRKNIQMVRSIFLNSSGHVCQRNMHEVRKLSCRLPPIKIGTQIALMVDLERFTAVFQTTSPCGTASTARLNFSCKNQPDSRHFTSGFFCAVVTKDVTLRLT